LQEKFLHSRITCRKEDSHMNKLVLATLIGVATIALAKPIFAYQGDPGVRGPNYSPERHEAMEQSFAKGDYQGWLKLMEGRGQGIKRVVTNEAIFKEFAVAHEQGADALSAFRAKYNLGANRMGGRGMGYQNR